MKVIRKGTKSFPGSQLVWTRVVSTCCIRAHGWIFHGHLSPLSLCTHRTSCPCAHVTCMCVHIYKVIWFVVVFLMLWLPSPGHFSWVSPTISTFCTCDLSNIILFYLVPYCLEGWENIWNVTHFLQILLLFRQEWWRIVMRQLLPSSSMPSIVIDVVSIGNLEFMSLFITLISKGCYLRW